MTALQRLAIEIERLEDAWRAEHETDSFDDGPRETGSGYDDTEPARGWPRYEESELAENGIPNDTGYHLF